MKEISGCYHSMLQYLAELDNTSPKKELVFKTYKEAGLDTRNNYWLDGKNLGALTQIHRKGGILVLTDQLTKTLSLPLDTKFDKVVKKVYKSVEEFNTPVVKAGEYKDSLGGGWSSKVQRYKVKDKYFAAMECTCGH